MTCNFIVVDTFISSQMQSFVTSNKTKKFTKIDSFGHQSQRVTSEQKLGINFFTFEVIWSQPICDLCQQHAHLYWFQYYANLSWCLQHAHFFSVSGLHTYLVVRSMQTYLCVCSLQTYMVVIIMRTYLDDWSMQNYLGVSSTQSDTYLGVTISKVTSEIK